MKTNPSFLRFHLGQVIAVAAMLLLLSFYSYPTKPKKSDKGKIKNIHHQSYSVTGAFPHPIVKLMESTLTKFDSSGVRLSDARFRKQLLNPTEKPDSNYVPIYKGDTMVNNHLQKQKIENDAKLANKSNLAEVNYTAKERKWVINVLDSLQKASVILNKERKSIKECIFMYYDENNIKRERRSIDKYGTIQITKYDKLGVLQEITLLSSAMEGGDIKTSKLYKLRNGNERVINTVNHKVKEIVLSKYTFDKMGNWVIDSMFTNDTLTYIKTRQIEYW